MRSIQARLRVGLVAILLVAGLVLVLGGAWLVDHALRRYLETGLRGETENLLAALVRGPHGLQLDEGRLGSLYTRPLSGRYFLIEIPALDIRWRSRSLWDAQLEAPPRSGLSETLADGPSGQRLLTYRADYQRYGQTVRVVVADDYNPLLTNLTRILAFGALLGLATLLLVLLLQRLIVRRALRPLDQVREQIAQLHQGRRSTLDAGVPIELAPLVEEMNALLRHTEDGLKRARHGIGNLGHALKTPLAVLTSLAERPELQALPEQREVLREQLARIRQRLERELRRARLAGEALPGAHLDAAELRELCRLLNRLHGEHLRFDCHLPEGLRLPWDREDLLELFGTLLDNAGKWADRQVRLEVAQREEGYLIRIEDDGPGVPEAQREAILERGSRLDEAVAGHGLGLGIAKDIVEGCGGTLALETSRLGGLAVVIRLPAPVRTASTR
ncbi:putative two-component sensor [Pseudomonas psychrotolerans L19]|uniref:ATP-binding protein n=1 Tax=Pseudomonas TaxID=286 RepID=UPI00023A38B7|nr:MULTISPECIES: sensor histidine kinase [Pseudomonas]EHK72658.1 putative two-component sensor [Pseudomonas psychrotolerans L19]MBA1211851.1 sensor histidine kinase [Pseudomonas psychrotolerans]TCQ92304.1 signal transduction histidine kinase [Pseudomonas sp. JUb52]